MPIIAVNVIKVLFALALYGFLFFVARAMRGHIAGPPLDSNPTPAPAGKRRTRAEDSPPPAPRRTTLKLTTPDGETQTVQLDSRVIVGRSAGADVTIDDAYSSDLHAAFDPDGEKIWVEDLGSTNGTTIDGTRITERTEIGAGVVVMVGRTSVQVR